MRESRVFVLVNLCLSLVVIFPVWARENTGRKDFPQPQSQLVHLWSQRFGDADYQGGYSVAFDPSGNVVMTGEFEGTTDFGGGPLTSAGLSDILLAKFDGNGNHLWSQRFGDASDQVGLSVAFDTSGNVVMTGNFWGTVDFGGGPLTSAGGRDIFLAKFDSSGNHLWSQRFGDASYQQGWSVATDPSGNVVMTGYFYGTVDFGGGPLTSAGVSDIFLAKFDSNGNHLWSQRFGDASDQVGLSVAFDPSGNVVMTGDFYGTVDFGGGPLTSAGMSDIFLAKFDSNGNHLWSQRFGDASNQVGWSVATDPSGNVAMTGEFGGTVDFGGGPLTSAGLEDIFLAKFDANGTHLWSQRFGDASNQLGLSVAFDTSGNVVMTGEFYGTVDFGGGPLTSAGLSDILLAKFDANGNHLWSQRFGDASNQLGLSVAFDTSGNVVMTGYFFGTVDFGGGPLTSAGSFDIFLAKFGVFVGVEEESDFRLPISDFRLMQNQPNPFNQLSVISFQLSVPAHISLNIYDLSGRLVETLVNDYRETGIYQLPITSNQLPGSGIYFYRLQIPLPPFGKSPAFGTPFDKGGTGDFTQTRKMIFLR